MVITVIGSAILVHPQLGDIIATGIPTLPEGSAIYALGLLGGTGGTITMASYGYWLREKQWDSSRHIPTMRLDASSAYIITGLFVIALIVMSAALLYGTGASVSGEEGLVTLATNLGNELHPASVCFPGRLLGCLLYLTAWGLTWRFLFVRRFCSDIANKLGRRESTP